MTPSHSPARTRFSLGPFCFFSPPIFPNCRMDRAVHEAAGNDDTRRPGSVRVATLQACSTCKIPGCRAPFRASILRPRRHAAHAQTSTNFCSSCFRVYSSPLHLSSARCILSPLHRIREAWTRSAGVRLGRRPRTGLTSLRNSIHGLDRCNRLLECALCAVRVFLKESCAAWTTVLALRATSAFGVGLTFSCPFAETTRCFEYPALAARR